MERWFLLVGVAMAQVCSAAGSANAFDVATMKQVPPQRAGQCSGVVAIPKTDQVDIVRYSNVSLERLIAVAYDIWPGSQRGPSWLNSSCYDIVAKMPRGVAPSELPGLLRALLAQEVGLRTHWDDRKKRGFALVVGSKGLMLAPAKPSVVGAPTRNAAFSDGQVRITIFSTTIAGFAKDLSQYLACPVVDETGVEGLFDIEFECSPDSIPAFRPANSDTGTASDASASLIGAVNRLGFRLIGKELPERTLIIDSVTAAPAGD
jgi:uncharacterized protein (TIGR03435 family)